jgi:hypothetical protein
MIVRCLDSAASRDIDFIRPRKSGIITSIVTVFVNFPIAHEM